MTIDIDLDVLDSVSKKTGSLANQVRASASRVNNVSNDVEVAWRSRSTASYTYEIDDTLEALGLKAEITFEGDKKVYLYFVLSNIV